MLQRTPQPERRLLVRAAFTLMELLVVMAIIVIIAGFGGYYVLGRLDEAKVTAAKIKAKNISNAIDSYYIDHDAWPQSLDALLVKSEIGKGPYLTSRDDILDPWGKVYQIDENGTRYKEFMRVDIKKMDVYTTVPDGTNRTVGNWSDQKK